MQTYTLERPVALASACEKREEVVPKPAASAVGTIFARTEKKYLIDRAQWHALTLRLAEHMQPDQYGKTHITSLYLDTPTYYLMRQSIEKPRYKEKFRIRWYGEATPDTQVFYEVKKKLKGTVYKRRVPMTYREAVDYTLTGQKPQPLASATPTQTWEGAQILREFDYAFSFYEGLAPAFEVAYDRTALVGTDDPDLRITFDTNLTWCSCGFTLDRPASPRAIIDTDRIVMEIKCTNAMPLWLTVLLDEFSLAPSSFSKAGTAYKALLKEEAHTLEGVNCAG